MTPQIYINEEGGQATPGGHNHETQSEPEGLLQGPPQALGPGRSVTDRPEHSKWSLNENPRATIVLFVALILFLYI